MRKLHGYDADFDPELGLLAKMDPTVLSADGPACPNCDSESWSYRSRGGAVLATSECGAQDCFVPSPGRSARDHILDIPRKHREYAAEGEANP
jgi:hypothetical protein